MVGKNKLRRELPLHILIIPGVILVFIFHYIPMFGIMMAFQKFVPAKGFWNSIGWVWIIFDIFLTCPTSGM